MTHSPNEMRRPSFTKHQVGSGRAKSPTWKNALYSRRAMRVTLILFCAVFWLVVYVLVTATFGATLPGGTEYGDTKGEPHSTVAGEPQRDRPDNAGPDSRAAVIPDGGTAAPPPGFVSFCMHDPDACTRPGNGAPQVSLDAKTRTLLFAVNDRINRAITYKSDREQFGVANRWYPDAVGGYGDCKDYALAKRQALLDAGIPARALRIAIVRTSESGLHAVLTVDTSAGTVVLDSLSSDIRPWSQTDYVWLVRQSREDPLRWVEVPGGSQPDDQQNGGSLLDAFFRIF